jgi:hypothetical protein
MVSSGMKETVDFAAPPATVRNMEEKWNTRIRAASEGFTRGKTPFLLVPQSGRPSRTGGGYRSSFRTKALMWRSPTDLHHQ